MEFRMSFLVIEEWTESERMKKMDQNEWICEWNLRYADVEILNVVNEEC